MASCGKLAQRKKHAKHQGMQNNNKKKVVGAYINVNRSFPTIYS